MHKITKSARKKCHLNDKMKAGDSAHQNGKNRQDAGTCGDLPISGGLNIEMSGNVAYQLPLTTSAPCQASNPH